MSSGHDGHYERAQRVRLAIPRPSVHFPSTFLHDLVKTELIVAVSLFPVCLARGHAARSFPRHCEHLQRDRGIAPMLPMSLIVNLGRSNAEFEAIRGRRSGTAAGPSSGRAPLPFFLPYRVLLVALVTVVVSFLFGVARNVFPASSKEVTSSAAMAPPWSASAQASAPPPFSQGHPICF